MNLQYTDLLLHACNQFCYVLYFLENAPALVCMYYCLFPNAPGWANMAGCVCTYVIIHV